MAKPGNPLRQLLVGVASVAGIAVVGYTCILPRDPLGPAWIAHTMEGKRLAAARPARAQALPANSHLPPLVRTGNPRIQPWILHELGIDECYHHVEGSRIFAAPETDETAVSLLVVHSEVQVAVSLWVSPRTMQKPANDSADFESAREPLQRALTAMTDRVPTVPRNLDGTTASVAPAILMASRRHDLATAQRLLDAAMEDLLADRGIYSPSVIFGAGYPNEVSGTVTYTEENSVSELAMMLDHGGADTALLNRMATALEKDVATPEEIAWMAEGELLGALGRQGFSSEGSAVYQTTDYSEASILYGSREYIDNSLQQPLLMAQYRDFCAAWLRGDIPAAQSAANSYIVKAKRMRLRTASLPGPFFFDMQTITMEHCRRCQGPPARMPKLEMARFVVAALRFRRAERRWPANLDELVPRWLPASIVPSDGARWGVRDLPEFRLPRSSVQGSVYPLALHVAETGELPPVDAGASDPPLVFPARPLFWRIGPPDPCGDAMRPRLANATPADRAVMLKALADGTSELRQVEVFTPVFMPPEPVLRLLGS